MFRTVPLLLSRLAGAPFWRRRPQSLHQHSGPQLVSRAYFRSARRRRDEPDDPTRSVALGSIRFLRCPNCRRVKAVEPPFDRHFHSCCEDFEMISMGNIKTMKQAMALQDRLLWTNRTWDPATSRPKSRPRWAMSRATSKLPKK